MSAEELAEAHDRASKVAVELQELARSVMTDDLDWRPLRPEERDKATRFLTSLVASWGKQTDLSKMDESEAQKAVSGVVQAVHHVITALYILGYRDGTHAEAARQLLLKE